MFHTGFEFDAHIFGRVCHGVPWTDSKSEDWTLRHGASACFHFFSLRPERSERQKDTWHGKRLEHPWNSMNILKPTWVISHIILAQVHIPDAIWCITVGLWWLDQQPLPTWHASTSSHKRKSLRPSGWGVACKRWTKGRVYVMVSRMTNTVILRNTEEYWECLKTCAASPVCRKQPSS